MSETGTEHEWSFLTNHGLALLVITHDPTARMRDIADAIGVTERTAQRVVTDLIGAGYVLRERPHRRNVYTVKPELTMRLPLEREVVIGELLSTWLRPERWPPPATPWHAPLATTTESASGRRPSPPDRPDRRSEG